MRHKLCYGDMLTAGSSGFPTPERKPTPCKGKCFSGMLKSFWAAEKTSCCWLEPTKIRRGRIGKENFRPTASPVAGNPAVRGQSYDDKRLWNNILSKLIAAYQRNMLPIVREVIQLPLFPCLFVSWFKKKQWFKDMRNDIVQYPKIQTGKHLPKRLSGSADNCIFNDSVTYIFNDFMRYCRQSSTIWNIVSPMHLICDELLMRKFTKAWMEIFNSVWKRQINLH